MQPRESSNRIDAILSWIVQYGILLYLLLMFLDKGNALRNIGLYGAFTAWAGLAATGRVRLTRDPETIAFATFSASVLISTALSINPDYSMGTLKKDFIKGLMLFAMISTVFVSIEAIERAGRALALAGIALLSLGLHGMFTGSAGVYTPENPIANIDKNTFGFAVSLIFPFYIYFLSTARGIARIGLWAGGTVWALAGVILSASRASILSIIAVIALWVIHYSGTQGKKALKKIVIASVVVTLLGAASFGVWPREVKNHFLSTGEQLATFNMRTYYFWKPAIEAGLNRPVAGWGFGEKIWRDPRPFEGAEKPYTELTGGLHSTFIAVFFEQGALGLLAYISIVGAVIYSMYRIRKSATGKPRLIAVCILGMAVGALLIEAFFRVNSIRSIGLVAGLSAALAKVAGRDIRT